MKLDSDNIITEIKEIIKCYENELFDAMTKYSIINEISLYIKKLKKEYNFELKNPIRIYIGTTSDKFILIITEDGKLIYDC